MTTEQRDIILNEIIINNPKIKADLLQACEGAQIDFDKLREVLPPAAFASKSPQGAGPRKAVVHRFWKPHTKDTLTTATCRDILTWLSRYGKLLTSDVNKFIDLVLRETRCPVTFNGALDLINNNILDVLYTADIIKPSKLTLHRHFDVDQNPIVDTPIISVRTTKQSRKEQNNKDYDLFEENDMNIYEQLNKINDKESLSEKYNVKNAKELKKLKESAATVKIPAPWNKYLEVDKYIPEEGEYMVGDKIGECTVVAYLAPKAAYEDKFDGWPMLFKDSRNNYVVGETSHDRVYSWDISDYVLTEDVSDAKLKLRKAAESVNLSMDNYFEEYALEDNGTHVDEVIENEILPVGEAVRKKFPNVAQWKFLDDDRFSAIQIMTWKKNARRWGDWNYEGFFEYAHDTLHDITDVVQNTFKSDQKLTDSSDDKTNEALSDPQGTKKCKDKATKILSELEAENFTEDEVVTVCRMIEDLIEQRYPETYKTTREKLKNSFPELDI